MNAILIGIVVTVLIPALLSELRDWSPKLSVWLVHWAARCLGSPEACRRYEEEWEANLAEVPGRLSKLVAGLGYLVCVPSMRWALRRQARRRAKPAPNRPKPTEAIASTGMASGRRLLAIVLTAVLQAIVGLVSFNDVFIRSAIATAGIGVAIEVFSWMVIEGGPPNFVRRSLRWLWRRHPSE